MKKAEGGSALFYYKDWDGQSRKKLKRGFETKKEAITYERNFTVKVSGSPNMLFEDYFELYKADVIGTIRLNTWMTKEHMIRTKILPFFSSMKMSEINRIDDRCKRRREEGYLRYLDESIKKAVQGGNKRYWDYNYHRDRGGYALE